MSRSPIRIPVNLWPVIALAVATAVLGYLNYEPGTWLSGWDNLHPELGIDIDLPRSLAAAWQEYRGLGLLGGMAHAADLPRQLLILVLLKFGFPQELIRYGWTFLMLGLGSVGAYFLATQTLLRKFDRGTRQLAGFFAGLFYMLNLGTVQNFYAPFETFTSFFGFLPWLLLSQISYLKSPSRNSAFILVLVHLLATPAFYVHTLFLVYLICLLPFYLGQLKDVKNLRRQLLHLFTAGLMLLFTSAYWLFPATYYALTSSGTTLKAAQNQVASREVIARNQEYGGLGSVGLLKGFWFDYVDLGDNNQFGLMLAPWVKHFDQPVTQVIGYLFFALALVAIYFAFKKNLLYRWHFALLFLLSLFFLANLAGPTRPLFRLFQEVPLVKEVFRSVFTKWVVPSSLTVSLFFGIGVVFLLDLFSGLHYRSTPLVTSFSLVLALVLYAAPAFQGHFIYEKMRVSLPAEYQELFAYLKDKDNGRLANFPQHTFWGWQFTDWGYRGSGFLWYGLKQPVLDRAFDVWSPYSQQYYRDIRHAVYSQDTEEFVSLLDKYAIRYLLLDRHVIVPGTSDQTTLYLEELETLIRTAGINKLKDFGKLALYEYLPAGQLKEFVATKELTPQSRDEVGQASLPPVILDTPLQSHSSLKEATNCDNFNTTLFTRTLTLGEAQYTAVNASSCDHFVYPDLPHNRPYVLSITHKNLAGEPFFVCLESHTSKQCELFQYLPRSEDWTTTTLSVPALKPEDKGYTLHLYNYSIGSIETINAWSQISIAPASTKITSYPIPNLPYAKIEGVIHPNPSLYWLKLASGQDSYLVLNQAYHAGWKAYRLDGALFGRWPLLAILTTFALPEANHFEFYGWANGWNLPSNTQEVVLFFTPQLWQYLGFAFLLFLPILIIAHHPKKAPEEGR